MPLPVSISQTSLAVAILGSTIGTYIALSPPNPSANFTPTTGDSLRWLKLTSKHTTKIVLAPLVFLALYTSSLVYLFPDIPPSILRHGAENGLNNDLITWSAATFVPLALILCAGIPLRLVSYSSLGKNFTFALTEPDRLTTTGIYRYVQHPSYTGIVVLVACNIGLLCRTDGALSCWAPPRWYQILQTSEWALAPVGFLVFLFGIRTRVGQEERMLQAEFKDEWIRWHTRTSRFIPGII